MGPEAATHQETHHAALLPAAVGQGEGRDLPIAGVHPQQTQARAHAIQPAGEAAPDQGQMAWLHLPLRLQLIGVQVRKDQQGAAAGQGKGAFDPRGDGPQPGVFGPVSHAGHVPGQERQRSKARP